MEPPLPDSYTQFPSLDYGQEPVPSLTSVTWECGGYQLDLDTLIYSWASILRHLSGEDKPVFIVDDKTIKSDLETRRFEIIEVNKPCPEHSNYTGIFTTDVQNRYEGCLLEVKYCFDTQNGSIVSRACTSLPYLAQIGQQLESALKSTLSGRLKVGNSDTNLAIVNPSPITFPGPQFLHDLVKRTGGQHPALEFLDGDGSRQTMSYDTLRTRSEKLASRVARALDKRGAIVPVLLPQCLDLYVAWLAILKAGAAVCPLNLDAPLERISFILNDTDSNVLVTSEGLAEKLHHIDKAIDIISTEDMNLDIEISIDNSQVHSNDLAYVMYTSGSTGLPKGVGISHHAAVQSLLAHDEIIPEFSRFLQFASPTFDVSVFEIFFPLFRGATLVGCDRRLMLDNLVGIINELEVDAAELTPTVAGELLRHREVTPSLNSLLTIGEMLTKHVVEEFGFSEKGIGILHGMYGPTETSIHCTAAPKFRAGSRIGNIGRPLRSVSTFIIATESSVADDVLILPVGYIGELAIGGPQLANCYLNRPEENKKAFVNSKTYGRLYRTGDKARLNPNGELECLGRISSGQVKLRGQRIELGEIESVLSKGVGVRNAAVCVLGGNLVAFVSMDRDTFVPQDLDGVCKRWLPKFMVPRDITYLEELPRLASGKIDRKTLERDYIQWKAEETTLLSKPANDIEMKISQCVQEVLHSSVDASSSLVSAGLDSLNAIKLASTMRKAGIDINVVSILEADSIRQISAISQKADFKPATSGWPSTSTETWNSIVEFGVNRLKSIGHSVKPCMVIPCSPIQTAMIVKSVQDPRAYSNWVELEFKHGIKVSEVKDAISTVALQNEILRSRFFEMDLPGHPYAQLIWDELNLDQVTECESFNYDVELKIQHDMMNPLKVQLRTDAGKIRALIHIHHSIYDGWSLEHIIRDLTDILEHTPPVMRPSYRLFIDYHLNRVSSGDRRHSLEYWKAQLEGVGPSLWCNFQNQSDIPKRLGVVRRQLDIDLTSFDRVARSFQVGRQAIFQAAVGYLLGAYSGRPDVVFGSVSSGRTIPIDEIENIIGPCISTVPLAFNLQRLRTVRDLLSTIHNLNRKSLAHQTLSLRDIKQASGIDAGTQLFDTLFVWQDTINSSLSSSEVVTEVESADFLEYTLTIDIEIRESRLSAKAIFQESILPSSQAELFLSQVEKLVYIILHNPDIPLQEVNGRLPESMLSVENDAYMTDNSLPSLVSGVETLAKSDPERIAVEFLSSLDTNLGVEYVQRLTYSGLDTQSSRLANCLVSMGVVAGDLVPIYLEKSLGLYISILAVVKAGAGYVPIAPQAPIKRVMHIIKESGSHTCITSPALFKGLDGLDSTVILMDGSTFEEYGSKRIPIRPSSSSVAYAVFTSGTTGVPKGVLISHHNLQSNIAALSRIYPDHQGSKLLQACSHAFDVSVFEIFFSWSRGMTLCSVENDTLFRDIERVVRTLNISHLSLTPTVAALINSQNVPNVKFLVTAGEPLTSNVLKNWANKGLWQGYGPSETTNICTVNPNFCDTNFANNIGRPLENTSAFVISEGDSFSLVPRGAFGELCFGGDQVGLGYLNMHELTQKKFINHPQYGRIYKSGDFGRMLPNGSIMFVGRQDDLVKLRGQRIELGEIDSVLLNHHGIKRCATIIQEQEDSGKQQLITFWVPTDVRINQVFRSEDQLPILQELFDHMSQSLPGYMVPSFLIPLEQIPRTTAGKVDKRGLLASFSRTEIQTLQPYSRGTEAADENEEFSEMETGIAELVSKVTAYGHEHVGRHTSFYRLGLDSISMISLSRQLKLAGFGQVDVSVVMKNDSVARLASEVQRMARGGSLVQTISPSLDQIFSPDFVNRIGDEISTSGMNVKKILPCTPLQEAMISGTMAGNHMSYYNHLTFEVFDRNVQKLKVAWQVMVARHDMLRTIFKPTNNAHFAFAQIVLGDINVDWEVIECLNADVASSIKNKRSAVMSGNMSDRLYFFTEVHCSDTERTFLCLSIHHALYDGEAMEKLLKEVEDVSFGIQLPPVVPFDLYLHQMVQTNSGSTDEFWREYLTGFSPTPLLTSPPKTGQQNETRFSVVSNQLDTCLTEVSNSCKKSSITLLSLLQAAWVKFICYLSGISDICFGDVTSGRSISIDGIENIIGPCFNTLPVRVKMDQNTVNLDLMVSLQNHKSNNLPYQLSSLRRLQSLFANDGRRLFDTLLLLQNSPRQLNEQLWKLVEESGNMDFPLVCEIIPNAKNDTLGLNFHFDTSVIPSKDANMMIQCYSKLIRHTLDFPAARAMDFSFMDCNVYSFVGLYGLYGERDRDSLQRSKTNHDSTNLGDGWTPEAIKARDLLSALSNTNQRSISLHTTIFQLGLDSINAIQIAGHFRKLGYNISGADILEKPSVNEIASLLDQPLSDASIAKTIHSFDFESFHSLHLRYVCQSVNLQEEDIESIRPCTPLQAGILALSTNSEGGLYFNSLCLKSEKPLNLLTLKKAWTDVMERNEMLRTGFCHIKDDEFPFSMVTYRRGIIDLPWNESFSDGNSLQSPGADEIGREMLGRIHRPPWILKVQACGMHTTVRISALHALYDAQSLNLILSEVSRAYKGFELPTPLPISPTLGFILEQSRSKSDESQNFWVEMVKRLQITKFPDMSPFRTENQSIRVLSKFCSKSLEELQMRGRELGITLQAAGQAAWSRILSSYTGECSVTYGLTLSARGMSQGSQDAVFPCLTTIPTQNNVEGTNGELLQEIMESNAKLWKHQFTPLTKIHGMAKSKTALYDTLFVFQKLSLDIEESNIWSIYDEEAKTEHSVSVELIPVDSQLKLCITFKDDILPKDQASILLDQLDWLLVDTLYHPDAKCSDYSGANSPNLSVVPRKDKRIQTSVQLLHQYVEIGARDNPSRIALEFASHRLDEELVIEKWSYQELNTNGNKYANLLRGLGVEQGALIAVCFDKCPDAYFSILGILKLGCAYLAIDPGAPIARKQFIMDDSKSKYLLCTAERKNELESLSGATVITVDKPGIFDNISSIPPVLVSPIEADSTCYCLYTSGSTGTPKGCEITHDNATQAMLSFQRIFDSHWGESSRWLQFASFHFDVSVLEQFWSWSVGICVTSCPRDLLFEDFSGTISDLKITHIDLTPSLARLLRPEDVPSLCDGVFITGGEQLKQEILDIWGDHQVIYNGYGPTEVTIGCTMLPRVSSMGKPSNIGYQFDNVSSFVLNQGTDAPVMKGGIGELCVSGPLVGRGYLNRPQLTKEKFPYIEKYGERVYRTGDLVRMYHDETFCFLGRVDDQVKLRGQRLETEEINHVIKGSHTSIGEVVTMVMRHSTGTKEQIVSFVTISKVDEAGDAFGSEFGTTNDTVLEEIRKGCHSYLPGYMIPTHIIPVKKLPLSPNNKIDRRQLENKYQAMSLSDMEKLSSQERQVSTKLSNNVRLIISVIAKMVNVDSSTISAWSNIFELGLDSISVITFAQLLHEAGFGTIRPPLVMKYPTIFALSKALQTLTGEKTLKRSHEDAQQRIAAFALMYTAHLERSLDILSDCIETVVPCTPLQAGMIYKCLNEDSRPYLSSFNFELNSIVDISRLKESWRQIQVLVQLLRAKFPLTDDGYAQVVLKDDTLPWFELTALNDSELHSISKAHYKQWCLGFTNSIGRIWEVGVVVGPTRKWMCLNIFHGIYDGNSLSLLLGEVARAYHGNEEFRIAPPYTKSLYLGPLCRFPNAEPFWTQHLQDSRFHRLSLSQQTQGQRPSVASLEFGVVAGLETLRRKLNVTEHAIYLACWLNAFEARFGYNSTIGVVTSGRTLDTDDANKVIGPLFNTVPCSITTSGLSSFSDLVQACHSYYVSMLPFQHTPLRDIMKWTKRSTENPLFDTLFVFQREDPEALSSTQSLWTPMASYAEADYPLAFEVQSKSNGSVELTAVAQNDVLSTEGLHELLVHYQYSLVNFVRDPRMVLTGPRHCTDDNRAESPKSVNNQIVSEDISNEAASFHWVPTARKIRQEIATLAGIDASEVTESISILEIGLDSIDAIKLSSRLKKLNIDLTVSKIMKDRSIMGMMTGLTSSSGAVDEPVNSLSVLEKDLRLCLKQDGQDLAGVEHVFPATPLQEGMVAEMMSSNYYHYLNHDLLLLEDGIDVDLLRNAWERVVQAHPILRTSFSHVSNPSSPFSYAQIVHNASVGMNWTVADITGKSIDIVLEEERLRATQLSMTLPLFRLQLLVDGDRTFLLVTLPHAMYDGWSLNLIHQDVATYYSGQHCDRPSYHKTLEHILNSGGNGSQFWKGALVGVRPRSFPQQADAGHTISKVHRKELTLGVSPSDTRDYCKSHGITMQTLGVTCWAIVLSSYLEQTDVVFGTVMHGRDIEEAASVPFPTMNTVAMREVVRGTRSEMLKSVQRNIGNIQEHQQYPLRKLKNLAGVGNVDLFDTLFIYQKSPDEGIGTTERLYTSITGSSDVEYPVCVEMEVIGESIIWRVACKDTTLGKVDADKLMGRIAYAFESIIKFPDELIAGSAGEDEMARPSNSNSLQCNESNFQKPNIDSNDSWSLLEQKIKSVLSSVANIPEQEITKSTTIFHLGIDSISAIKVSSQLKKISIILSVRNMLHASTIGNMAALTKVPQLSSNVNGPSPWLEILHDNNIRQGLNQHGIDPQAVESLLPATSGQIYMLESWRHSNGTLFFPDFFYRVEGKVDRDQLENGWAQLTAHLPILRTTFLPTMQQNLRYVQVVLKDASNPIIWRPDLRDASNRQHPSHKQGSGFANLFASQTRRETLLMLHIHHALYDAVALRQIIKLLQTFCQNPRISITSKIDISEFINFSRMNSPLTSRKEFWTDYLRDAAPDLTNIPEPTGFANVVGTYCPSLIENVESLKAIGRQHGLTVQALFLAIYAKTHIKTFPSPNPSLVVGLYLANRSHPLDGLSDLVAPTLNIIPLRIDNPQEKPVIKLAQSIQADLHMIGRIENCTVSLFEIAEWTGVKLDTTVNFLLSLDGPENVIEEPEDTLRFVSIEEQEMTGRPWDGERIEQNRQHDQLCNTIGPLPSDMLHMPKECETNTNDIFKPSVDVEVAIRNESLDVGIFGPAGRINKDIAEAFLDELQRGMVSCS